MNIGVVGYGYVGKATARHFEGKHEVHAYDKYICGYDSEENKDLVNSCDLVFVAVPTPTADDGISCDLSAIEEVFGWLEAPACVRSTIPPGTIDRLQSSSLAPVAFSPEYIGESHNHPWREIDNCGFVIVGGAPEVIELVKAAYSDVNGAPPNLYPTTARAAELCKYMENCFLATKVTFVNQFFDLANLFDVDFQEVRKLWLLDPRISHSHTEVTVQRGFGGRCLPKDMRAMVAASRALGGDAPLLRAVLNYNDAVRTDEPVGSLAGAQKEHR
jgi:UDPglucose 6-dehydrogenase